MQAKVAFVVISDHAFIPSFAPYNVSMKATREPYINEVRKDATDFLKKLGAEVVLDEWVHDVESARETASKLRKTDFDLLTLTVPIWPGGDSILELAKSIRNTPILIWSPVIPMGHLCGYFEVTSNLTAVGVKFEPAFGKTPEAEKQIKCYIKAAATARKLSMSRIGQIGYTPQAFVDVTASELDLRARFGVEIAHLDVSELLLSANRTAEKEAEKLITELRAKAGEVKVSDRELVTPAKICVALDRMIEKYKLGGYALSCSPMNFEVCHPCLAVSKSTEQNVPGSCEGDLPSAIMLKIMLEIAEAVPAVLDVDSGDIERNVLNFWHCGHLATQMAETPAKVAITLPLYEGDIMGPGAVFYFPMRPGKVTMASLSSKGDRMFITTGEALRVPKGKGSGAYSEVKLDSRLIDVLKVMAESGVGHHLCVVHGDVKEELRTFCKILDIETILC